MSAPPPSADPRPARLPWRPDFRQDWLYLLLASAVAALTCYRAATTSVTYDEAETFLRYVQKTGHADKNALFGFGFLSVQRANNHPLNTILIDVTSCLRPYDELLIRLPNLAMCALYLLLAVGVSRRFQSRPLVFGLLALNYSLDEFFGLGRGYGLSAGFVLMALAVSPAPEPGGAERGLRLSLWLLLLASLANYTAVVALAAFGLETLLARGPGFVLRALRAWSSLAFGLLLGFVLWALRAVSAPGKPLAGDPERGFWDPVVGSYLRMFVPGLSPERPPLIAFGVALFALALFGWLARWRTFHLSRCLALLLALVVAASHVLGKPMPTERVLLPFWPLVALALGELSDQLAGALVRRAPGLTRPLRAACLLLLAALALGFARQTDLRATRDWREDYALAEAIREPLARGECLKKRYMGHPVTNFYVKKAGRDWLDPALVCPKPGTAVSAR